MELQDGDYEIAAAKLLGGIINRVGVATAARMLRVSKQRVHELIRCGGLASGKVDGHWQISVRSIEAYRDSRRPVRGGM